MSLPAKPLSVTSATWTPQTELDFRASLLAVERVRLLWGLGLGAILVSGWGFLDVILYPAYVRTLWTVRGIDSLVLLACLPFAYFTNRYVHLIAANLVGLGSVGIAAILIGHLGAGQQSLYFSGILIVQAFAAILNTVPVWYMLALNFAFFCGYLIPLATYPTIDVPLLIYNLYLIGSGAFVSTFGCMLRLSLARQEYAGRIGLAQSNAELQSLHQMKDQMFQNVSHEFRTPLTLIIAPLEEWLAHPEDLKEGQRERYESMRRSALRLLNLINDLLDLAKLGSAEAATESLADNPEDLSALLNRIGQDVAPLAKMKGVDFSVEIPAGSLIYRTAGRPLEKIVLNLLSNALKFTPRGGKVGLKAQVSAEGALTIAVSDTGIGIPAEAHARIFERFRQMDGSTTRRFGGTGIGLSLVAELAKVLGAKLSLESVPGQGTTFRIVLPPDKRAEKTAGGPVDPVEPTLALARQAAYAALAPEVAHTDVRSAGDHGPRILLAEDDPQLNAEIVRMLAGTYRVRSVTDGALALQEAQRDPPDLLLSDVMMPGMDGVTLAKSLRQHPALRDTAIVLLSARASLEDRVKGREVGVDTYLTKPFNPRELLATAEGLLRARMRVVGKYLVGRRLGEGAQCEVYRAEHLETGQIVALKMLSARVGAGDEGESWLAREREALTRLSHPNIVRILEQGHQEHRFYMVMEYLEGKTLGALSAMGARFDSASTSAIGQALSGALAAVHNVGLVHRDVKRENIMIAESGPSLQARVKLIDFGVVLDTRRGAAAEGETAGTLLYMAPELLKGAPASFASDQYATGVCLYQLLTGQHPFQRDSRSETIAAILAAEAPPIAKLDPTVPPALIDIIAKAMNPHPSERWPDMSAMAQALGKLAAGAVFSGEAMSPRTEIGVSHLKI